MTARRVAEPVKRLHMSAYRHGRKTAVNRSFAVSGASLAVDSGLPPPGRLAQDAGEFFGGVGFS
ncbi:hypothetical protein, partial [Methylobacterium gregans]|uniref:hypothetical protein n=1 Tax=Methylobacterium gregans TaxID=374424 RepID=UPI001EE2F8CD